MPIKKCTVNGKSGHKFGDSGKCYTGKDSAKKAASQGIAEMGKEAFENEMGKADNHLSADILIYAKRELDAYEKSEAKIVRSDNGFKILGLGLEFDTVEDAVDFQYASEYTKGEIKEDKLLSTYGYVTKKEREATPDKDFADPKHKKYPISTKDHLKSAIKLYGRSKDTSPEEVKKNIIRIAKRKGADWVSLLPEDWV